MSYMFITAPCIGCKTLFSFNADLVPSVRHLGQREPICKACVDRVNPTRIANGVGMIFILPGAYEPQEVS